jgi:hypothetical protein
MRQNPEALLFSLAMKSIDINKLVGDAKYMRTTNIIRKPPMSAISTF